MRVIIDGTPVEEAEATISIFDWSVLRGFGCFEVVRSYEGTPFRLDAHLDRLARSSATLHLPEPDRDSISASVRELAAEGGDCQVRIVHTGGGRDPAFDAPSRTIVVAEPVPALPDRLRLLPVVAPWHPATDGHGFAGVKWTSYAPNMATSDQAVRAGFDDALLLTVEGKVLEGPTFTVAWMADGALQTPSMDLGILPSITRDVLFESAARIGLPIKEGRYPLERLLGADEVMALSTVKEVLPVVQVRETEIEVGPVAPKLSSVFRDIVAEETGAGSR